MVVSSGLRSPRLQLFSLMLGLTFFEPQASGSGSKGIDDSGMVVRKQEGRCGRNQGGRWTPAIGGSLRAGFEERGVWLGF